MFAIGDRICNVNIIQGTFIELSKNKNFYIVNSNIEGLKSLLLVLKKLKKIGNNFVHLSDVNINGCYINDSDYFFDSPSMALDLYKLKSSYREDKVSEYEGLNQQLCLQVYFQRKTLIHLIDEIKKLIKKEKGIIIFKFKDELNSILNINLSDYKAKRH